MRICDQILDAPQLVHHRATTDLPEHWALYQDVMVGGEAQTYVLRVRFHYGDDEGPNHYSFYVCDGMGDYIENVSADEYNRRYEAVLMNEGEEAVDSWIEAGTVRRIQGIENDIKTALIKRWEALCELITPHVTM